MAIQRMCNTCNAPREFGVSCKTCHPIKVHDCAKDGHVIIWAITMGTCSKCNQVFNNEMNDNLELDQVSNYY